ncbi:hypothetical protein PG993_005537 [Apiospora rasikravindrae]|uniref:Co-chaperone HscB C-terminal oligomerisation domain-containing protein n=1 Tax=Apiospora rasikravindrae TaxID=990691 RepID=A0ABR1TIL3_9PEZI
MRSSLLPRRRPLERICDACQQQRRELSSSTNRSIGFFSKPSPSPCTTAVSTPRRSKAPTASLISSRAFSRTRNTQGAEAASPKPAEPDSSQPQEQQQQQEPSPPPHGPFAVDVPTLRREFLRLQAKAHPDMHPQTSKNRAEAASARINEAFKTLTNPLLRAQYLLELAGRGDNPGTDESAKVEDPELLMEVLEAREMIEEAESEAALEPLREENAARERGSERVLGELFARGDLEGAAHEAVRLRYWVNIREGIDAWEKGEAGGAGALRDTDIGVRTSVPFWLSSLFKVYGSCRERRLFCFRDFGLGFLWEMSTLRCGVHRVDAFLVIPPHCQASCCYGMR